MTEWKEQANEWMRIAYSAKTSQLLPKYQYHILDRCLRGASDIISCESISVHSNTSSLIQWCKLWSEVSLQRIARFAMRGMALTKDGLLVSMNIH